MIDACGGDGALIVSCLSKYHVLCDVSGEEILLSDLTYWNNDKQVAYKGVENVRVSDFYPAEIA